MSHQGSEPKQSEETTQPQAQGGDELAEARSRYESEKALRLASPRPGTVPLEGALAHYRKDPHVAPTARPPACDHVDAVVIGAGLGGLLAGARLREAGLPRVRLIDRAGDVGGVWYWNRYPGAMCDTEAYVYLPLLEELNYVPRQKYATSAEIRAHARAIAEHYGLYPDALFQTSVASVEWHEDERHWRIDTDRGDIVTANYVVIANGLFTTLKVPAIPGIDSYGGVSFHTSRWDYAYTGGSEFGAMTNLRDKSVGIIGTGATAIQCIPQVAAAAEELFVFQRTPSAVGVRDNRLTDPDWAASLQPGWQRGRIDNFTRAVSGHAVSPDLVMDGWTRVYSQLAGFSPESGAAAGSSSESTELVDLALMDEIRARIDRVITDPRTAAALKPYYPYLCKRPCWHDEYLHSFNRPNVTLVDTHGRGVDRIDESGVHVGDRHYRLDALVFATGFDQQTPYAGRLGYPVTGRDGQDLAAKWQSGISTLHGTVTSGFPNLFILPVPGAQSVVSVNYTHVLGEHAAHAAHIVKTMRERGVDVFDVAPEAEKEWVETVVGRGDAFVEFLSECTPGRFNNEGNMSAVPAQNRNYGGGAPELFELLAAWRRAGDFAGLVLEAPVGTPS